MKPLYEHTQIGYLIITAIGGILLLMIYLVAMEEFHWASVLVMLIFFITLLLFATLKISIYDDWLIIRFGIGMIRKKIALKDIQSVQAIKYPWYYGWGLRISLRGEWIYSVSGFGAVKVHRKNRSQLIIGTDDPEGLARSLRKAIEEGR